MGTANLDSNLPSLISTALPLDFHSLTKTTQETPACFSSMAIWYYDRELSANIKRLMEVKLCQTFETTETFTERIKLMSYLSKESLVLDSTFIICSEHVKELSHLIKDKSNGYRIYELDTNLLQTIKRSSNSWTTFNNVDELFDSIVRNLMKTRNQNEAPENNDEYTYKTYCPPLGIFSSTSIPRLFHNLNKSSAIFLLFQLLNEIITKMEYGKNELEVFCSFCRKKFLTNKVQMNRIKTFQNDYSPKNAISYYTNEDFLFQSLREIFQNHDTCGIFNCGCYIADLHRQLEEKHKPIHTNIELFRGKKISTIVFQQLLHLSESTDLNDKLISMNGFFSTSQDREAAEMFAGIAGERDGYVSVVFTLKIKQGIITKTPHADIMAESCKPDEKEYLFSVGSIWKLLTMIKRNGVWEVELELSNEFDGKLTDLNKQYFTECHRNSNEYYRFLLARILHKLGRYSQAGELYGDLLVEGDLDESLKHLIRLHFSTMKIEQGQYNEALEYLKQILEQYNNTCNSQAILAVEPLPSQAIILNTMGLLYEKKNKIESARESFCRALQMSDSVREKSMIHSNLGNMENLLGNTAGAEYHLQKARELSGDNAL